MRYWGRSMPAPDPSIRQDEYIGIMRFYSHLQYYAHAETLLKTSQHQGKTALFRASLTRYWILSAQETSQTQDIFRSIQTFGVFYDEPCWKSISAFYQGGFFLLLRTLTV
jgi:hypothetical protein